MCLLKVTTNQNKARGEKPVNQCQPNSPGSSSWPLPPLAPLWGFPPSRRGVCRRQSLPTSHPSEVPAARGWWTCLLPTKQRRQERTQREEVPYLITQTQLTDCCTAKKKNNQESNLTRRGRLLQFIYACIFIINSPQAMDCETLSRRPSPRSLYRTHYTTNCFKVSQFDLRTSINTPQRQMWENYFYGSKNLGYALKGQS